MVMMLVLGHLTSPEKLQPLESHHLCSHLILLAIRNYLHQQEFNQMIQKKIAAVPDLDALFSDLNSLGLEITPSQNTKNSGNKPDIDMDTLFSSGQPQKPNNYRPSSPPQTANVIIPQPLKISDIEVEPLLVIPPKQKNSIEPKTSIFDEMEDGGL